MGLTVWRIVLISLVVILAAGCSEQPGVSGPSRVSQEGTPNVDPRTMQAAPGGAPQSTTTTTYVPPRKIEIDPGKKLLFDNAHKEIFTPLSKAQLGYSAVDEMLKRYGYATSMHDTPLTPDALKDVDAVVIAGPMALFTEQEINDLVAFVNDGGDLLITLHLGEPVAALVERFGLQISSSVIAQAHDTFEGNPKWFVSSNVARDVLTEGVSSVAVQASWGLRAAGANARIIVSSAPDSWADVIVDDVYDKREPVAAYGLVGAATAGKGRVVVIADDAVLTNKTIEMASNRRLLENILIWFEESNDRWPLKQRLP